MDESNEKPIAPPPIGQGYGPAKADHAPAGDGQFWSLVRVGFSMGIGIALAFAAITACVLARRAGADRCRFVVKLG